MHVCLISVSTLHLLLTRITTAASASVLPRKCGQERRRRPKRAQPYKQASARDLNNHFRVYRRTWDTTVDVRDREVDPHLPVLEIHPNLVPSRVVLDFRQNRPQGLRGCMFGEEPRTSLDRVSRFETQ